MSTGAFNDNILNTVTVNGPSYVVYSLTTTAITYKQIVYLRSTFSSGSLCTFRQGVQYKSLGEPVVTYRQRVIIND